MREDRPGTSSDAGDGQLLAVTGLSKSFGGVRAVIDVNLDVAAGTIVGLIGPNGAGKTTVLNLITGFLIPQRGSISVLGLETSRLPPHAIQRLGVARTFQQIRLFRNMTVAENCLAGMHGRFSSNLLHVLGRTRRFRREVVEALDEVYSMLREYGLGGLATRGAGTLSYGEQRRVEIARALLGNPRLLCLDEPTAGMNQRESDELSDLVSATADRGLGVLLIEHDMRVVRRLCSAAMVLKEGQVLITGKPETILRDKAVIDAYLGRSDAHN